MADVVEVDISTLKSDVGEMQEKLTLVNNDMIAMFDAVEALDATWDGPASETFRMQFLADKQIFEELSTAVEGILNSIEHAVEQYTKCEAEVSSIIDGIKIEA